MIYWSLHEILVTLLRADMAGSQYSHMIIIILLRIQRITQPRVVADAGQKIIFSP